MKTIKLSFAFVALLSGTMPVLSQQVASCDMAALIKEMPALPQNISEAFQISYVKDATKPNAESLYADWLKKVDAPLKEGNNLAQQFYQKNPMGIQQTAQPAPSRVSPEQKAAFNAAKSEMMQKVMSDPTFAQKLMHMSEAEQQTYFTKVLAEKGIVAAQGTPNMPSQQPAGMDVNWLEICQETSQSVINIQIFEAQQAIQARYVPLHEEVNQWATNEIQKLPLIVMGEYGRDHDPEKVKAIQQQARIRHKILADKEWQELMPALMQQREKRLQDIATLNTAIKKVDFGKAYNFGLFYTHVLQTQLMAINTIQSLMTNEKGLIEACAKWQFEVKSDN